MRESTAKKLAAQFDVRVIEIHQCFQRSAPLKRRIEIPRSHSASNSCQITLLEKNFLVD